VIAATESSPTLRFCAVFVDFENVYYTLANSTVPSADTPLDQAIELLANLRPHLRDAFGSTLAVGRAYGDFDRIGGAQGQLQLLGFNPRFMVATSRKNSSDILLSIDAIETLLTRPELDMFVIVGGDRDYLPIVLRMRELLKRVLVVGFHSTTSGDLRVVIGEDNFIPADSLLPRRAEPPAPEKSNGGLLPASPVAPVTPSGVGRAPYSPTTYSPSVDPNDEEVCMREFILASYRHGEEVWLGPFLRNLSEKLTHLDHRGRTELLSRLVARGAITISKLEGVQGPYSVVKINWNDPWVREVAPDPA